MELFIGKKFKIISDGKASIAEIIDIKDAYAVVIINGIKFKVDKSKLLKRFSNREEEEEFKANRKCENCMEYKSERCYGESKICDDYRPSPEISEEEKSRWPREGSVSRLKSDNYFNREYDEMYNKYYH